MEFGVDQSRPLRLQRRRPGYPLGANLMHSDDELIAGDVDRMGWSCLTIHDTEPPFAYTVGLIHSYKHPELILFGRPNDDSAILHDLVAAIRDGNRIDTPNEYRLLEGFPVATRPVHETHHEFYFGFAMGFMRRMGRIGELEAVQVFVSDIDGRYPFEPNCALPVYQSQPRLDIPLTESELDERRRECFGT